MVSLGFVIALVLGPPGPTEVIAPVQQPGEPAIAPAELPSDRASAPVVQRPGQTEPTSDPGLPSYQDEPSEPEPSEPGPSEPVEPPPGDESLPTWSEEPIAEVDDPFDDPWNEPGMPPPKLPGEPSMGIGLMIGGGIGFAAVFTRQWITELVCTDVYCGFRGNLDRLVLLGSIGMIGGGAWMKGRHKGFMRNHDQQPRRPLLGRRATGWTLFALGMAGMIGEAGLYMACYDGARGPFVEQSGLAYTCRPTASVLMMDGSAVMASIGFGLAMSAQAERREMARGGAKVTMLPYASAGRAGVALVGRF
ncbi:hypothetical protein ACNOYE_17445 [Nannocystaceae bacterium ST9]